MNWKTVGALFIAFLIPIFVFAQGLVPCGNPGQPMCQLCHLATLLNNVMNWLVGILFLIFAITVIVAGYRLVTSAGNTQTKDAAKRLITNAFIGFIIVLAAWLLIDFIMRQLLSTSGPTVLGPWQSISCVSQPVAQFVTQGAAISTASGAPISCQVGVDASGNPIYDCAGVCPNGTTPVPNPAGTAVTCTIPNAGGGSCTVAGAGNACDPSNLSCFSNPSAASQVCMLESSGGNAAALSGTDLCQDGNSFSVGLWQINLLVNSSLIPGCPGGLFTSPSCGANCQGQCVRRTTNSNGVSYCAMWDCSVAPGQQAAYNSCVAAAQNPTNNNAAACSLYASQGRSAWLTSANTCGVNP